MKQTAEVQHILQLLSHAFTITKRFQTVALDMYLIVKIKVELVILNTHIKWLGLID